MPRATATRAMAPPPGSIPSWTIRPSSGSPFSYLHAAGPRARPGPTSLLKPANTLLHRPSHATRTEGQANFVNPGTLLVNARPGGRGDTEAAGTTQRQLHPVRGQSETRSRPILLDEPCGRARLGYDLSVGFTYRPTLTQNIIINAGVGVLLPGKGYRDIYRGTHPTPCPDLRRGPVRARSTASLYSAI